MTGPPSAPPPPTTGPPPASPPPSGGSPAPGVPPPGGPPPSAKPIYKRAWFIVIAILFGCAFLGALLEAAGVDVEEAGEDLPAAQPTVTVTAPSGSEESESSDIQQEQADETKKESAKKPGKAKFKTTNIRWQAVNASQIRVTFTLINRGSAAGKPSCFVEVDAADIHDECFGECGAQEILSGARLGPGQSRPSSGVVNIQGGAAPAVYDVDVLC